ncbi:S-layer homology domain-containing protein [Maledivibacter halophilus]|uniref:S-layer homology domain-containing protein n=1 Tax=Maledivibacter halophilus TaxID=36842 RepID=A0A1T5K0K3_9FIRM|nr:S-layer homology domain-containing protein [Maledivibacter halophilus]SKC57196.1 S-layer homology domain-containing protein [Maledivibacter halophilus]
MNKNNFRILVCLIIAATIISQSFEGLVFAQQNTTQENAAQQNEPQQGSKLQKEINKAVNRLVGFGIASGKDDGQYHPEQNITRAEFAKMIVNALDIYVDINVDKLNFTDVDAKDWSAPYIYIASSSGFIKGYEDNTFKPNENITFAQACAIALRSIGYKDEVLQGDWPNNFIVKASELRIIDGIVMENDVAVNRGQVALIIDRLLNQKMLIPSFPKGKFREAEDIILEDRLGIFKFEDSYVLSKEVISEKDYVNIRMNIDGEEEKKRYKYVPEVSDILLAGNKLDVYINDEETIIYAENSKGENNGESGEDGKYGNSFIENGYEEAPVGQIKINGMDDFIDIDKDCKIYIDNEEVKKKNHKRYLKNGQFGVFRTEDGKLIYANILQWDSENYYVKAIDIKEKTIDYIGMDKRTNGKIELNKDDENYKFYLVNGADRTEIKFEELAKGDIINITDNQENKDIKMILAFRNVVKGKFDKLYGGYNGRNIKITLKEDPSKEYNLAEEFIYSYKNGEKIYNGERDDYNATNYLKDFYEENVSLYLDYKGDIAYIEGNFNLEIDSYGVLVRYGDAVRGEIQIYNKDGKRKVYAFEDSSEYERLKDDIPEGSIIKYSIGKSKKLRDLDPNIYESIILTSETSTIKAGDDFGEDFVTIEGDKYEVDSDTIYFDYTDHNPYNVKKIDWERLQDKKVIGDVEVIYANDDDKLKLLVIWDDMDKIQEKTEVGYVENIYRLGHEYYADIVRHGSSEVKQYTLHEGQYNIYPGRLILFKINTDNELELMEDEEFQFISDEIDGMDGDTITIDGEEYRIRDDSIILVGNKMKSRGSLDKGDRVDVYINDPKAVIISSPDYRDYKLEEGTLMEIDTSREESLTIEVDGDLEEYQLEEYIDYIYEGKYIQIENDKKSVTEFLEDILEEEALKNGEYKIKFAVNRDTGEIYRAWIY